MRNGNFGKGVVRFLFFLLCFFCASSFAATQVSLLTSMPSGRAVFTLWGHSALRVRTDSTDVVFNYGVFSFDDGFVYKFVKGETDYWLDKESVGRAIMESVYKNVYLYEQVLNISEEETGRLVSALEENAKKENRYYRYNFFYDNCATRPRDLIEKILGEISYKPLNNTDSYRDKIHVLTSEAPWLCLGIDFCLGKETDEVIKDYDLMFLPFYLMESYDGATRKLSDGSTVQFVAPATILNTPVAESEEETLLHWYEDPVPVLWLCFFIVLVLTLLQYRKGSRSCVFDAVLFVVYGLFGLVLAFLVFVSTHPCTNPNFNLFWCNPLQLLFPILAFVGPLKKYRDAYLWVNFVLCCLPLIGWFGVFQKFHPAMIPLILIMLVRSGYLLGLDDKIKKMHLPSKKFEKKG